MALRSVPWLLLPLLLVVLVVVPRLAAGSGEATVEYLVNVILIQNDHLPWSLDKVAPFIALGIEHANGRLRSAGLNAHISATYDNFISFSGNPQKVCIDTDCGAKEKLQDITENNLLGCAVIGPTCQYAAYALLRVIKRYERMVVSAGSFGLSTTFVPELTRTLLSAAKVSTFFVDFWRLVQPQRKPVAWSTAYVLSGNSYNYDVCLWYIQALLENIKVASGNKLFNSTKAELDNQLIEVPTLDKLSNALMTRESNVVIFCGDVPYIYEVTNSLEKSVKNIFQQLVFVALDLFGGGHVAAERNYTIKGTVLIVTLPTLNVTLPVAEQHRNASNAKIPHVNKFAEAYYETMLIYGDFLKRSLQDGTFTCSSTDATTMRGKNYIGKDRMVHIDENGDSEGELEVLYLHNNKFHVVWQYDTWKNTFREVSNLNFTLPTDIPERKENHATIIALFAISIIFIVLILGFLLLWRKYSVERQLRTQRWVIPWVKLEDLPEDENNSTHEVHQRKLSVYFVPDGSFESDAITNKKYDNKVVMLKPLKVYDGVFTNTQKRELCLLISMACDNLTKFYGTTVGGIGVTYAVTDYCSRGSLWDILQDEVTYPEDTLMDWEFKVSIMHDIAKGMVYLQNKIGAHGRLKSINCVVDSRMVVKVTDFGLISEREDRDCSLKSTPRPENAVKEKIISYAQMLKARTRGQNKLFNRFIARRSNPCDEIRPTRPSSKLWMAPEHLRVGGVSPKGDVYSFGIILQELLYRRGVFYIRDGSYGESEIIERLMCTEDTGHFRPTLEESVIVDKTGGNEMFQMISDCWDENPERRPDFKRLEGSLKRISNKIHQGHGGTYVDSLIWRLEQYSKNLERLVEERTHLYKRERDRADELNYQLLPKSAVMALKARGFVEPELFDAVTIYFSDIVGFTTICKHSEPMEVVCLLNDLYKAFDAIVDSYDVYKVETIGDAYMVVSGLPRRNGARHAAQIADMALDILDFVGTFQVDHFPGLPLWVRIGIHSGGCAAGVVGNKMPRYCLFGDTVNTASRIESTGLPWRIHTSTSTVKILTEIESGHMFEERGLTELKGRGTEVTYWLIGKEDLTKTLPVPPEIDIGHGMKGEFEEMIKDLKRRRRSNPRAPNRRPRRDAPVAEELPLEYLQILIPAPDHEDTLL
ncbi:guanylyl cyclase C-like [Lampetra fluviatilis]